jgi:glucose/arabinose dehydrogenase
MGRFAALTAVSICLIFASAALATPPVAPTITEPPTDNRILNPADVHMEAGGFSDADGNTHTCSDWEIQTVSPPEVVWQAPCAIGVLKVHIHLGDGTFVNSYAGRTELNFDTAYVLRVRFKDSAGELSAWSQRPFRTSTAGPAGTPAAVPWAARQAGYEIEIVAGDLQLPTNIAMVPNPGTGPGDPFLYITELYGTIKVVTRDGTVRDYATGLLNFNPTGAFPGSGEQGLTGIAVDPASGDVFASMVYEDTASTVNPKPHYPKVVRFHSSDGGLTAATQTTIRDMPGESEGQSHQISNLTIGPDGKLYVHNGDGFETAKAQNLASFKGKILRMNLDGTAPTDNPIYNASDGITARDYVYAYGFRNPFGGGWRSADGSHYEVENGPSVDRFAQVVRGRNYLWDGSDASMQNFALYNWSPAHAPVNIAFVEPQTAFGSGFPFAKMGHAFVTESGPTYATGPQSLGKRIVEFAPGPDGTTFNGTSPTTLVEYTGAGKATAVGLAAGPDGLYFTDLYKDMDATSPIQRGANLLRIRYVNDQPSYPRPKGASPFWLSLVPAYDVCSSPNRTHGAPLSDPSCAPPRTASSTVTIGQRSIGYLRAEAGVGDVGLRVNITDVRRASDLSDYTGQLEATAGLRITDTYSGSTLADPATLSDLQLSFSVPCTAATCSVSTTADAITPGMVGDGKRTIWQVSQVEVRDHAGAPFARQGVFVP